MSQRVCKKVSRTSDELVNLPDDVVIEFFSRLNYRDRANLSATCSRWRRLLGRSQCLWQSLDLRMHKFNVNVAESLASRCVGLRKVQFLKVESANALIDLQARELKEISSEYCSSKISDETLNLIVSNHKTLEILQLGQDFFERITSDAIKEIAGCCSKLQKLRLSGIKNVDGVAISALARNCPDLTEIGFIDCLNVDMKSLGDVLSLRFLSLSGSLNINWSLASEHLCTLPNLKCLDISRTDVVPDALSKFLSTAENLLILSAMNCPAIDDDPSFVDPKSIKDKLLITLSTNIFKGVFSLFADTAVEERYVFSSWRNIKIKEKNLNDIMIWLEWSLTDSLLRFAKMHPTGLSYYWLSQGVQLLLSLTQSSQEDVQERAIYALSTFALVDYKNNGIAFAEAVAREGGIILLLNLAKSWREWLQFEAAMAIKVLVFSPEVKKVVVEVGGIYILADLARSTNRLIAEEAVGGLWNLSAGEIDKDAYAGVVQVLVDVISKWTRVADGVADGVVDRVLKHGAGVLANLADNNKYSMLIVEVGGLTALVKLARMGKCVQKQVARALANLAAHEDRNLCNTAVGEEFGAVKALVQLLHSPCNGVRKEALVAVSNLCFYARNREAIAAAGGVDALVSLAHSCVNAPHEAHDLQERVVRALRKFFVSEAHSILVGAQGGMYSLLRLARSTAENVHESAAEALWTLSFHPINAIKIYNSSGLSFLAHNCTSFRSKMVQFVSALTLTYILDGRVDEFCLARASSEPKSKIIGSYRLKAKKSIDDFIFAYSDQQLLSAVSTSSSPILLAQVAESVHILEAGHLRCSGAEIERFTVMLRNSSDELKTCAAFALLQFTFPGNEHALHHANLLQNTRARAAVRAAAVAATAPVQSKIFAKIVLRNLEHHQKKTL